MNADQIASLAAVLNEIGKMESRLRAMHFEVALLLDEARGDVVEEPELEETA